MKPRATEVESFLRKADSLRGVLLFGTDGGLVSQRAQDLIHLIVGKTPDPFLVRDLDPDRLKKDPSLLMQEAASPPLTGERMLLRLRATMDAPLAKALQIFLKADASDGEAFLLIEAGTLSPASALRKCAQAADAFAAIGCYPQDARSMASLLRTECDKAGLAIEEEAIHFFTARLAGGDRGITAREIEKLLLYAMDCPSKTITLTDILASLGDTAYADMEDAASAIAEGDAARAMRILDNLRGSGQSADSLLLMMSRYFQRLHRVVADQENGVALSQSLSALTPPLHFTKRDRFIDQTRLWNARAVEDVLLFFWKTLAALRQTGAPQEVLCGHALLATAQRARRLKGAAR